MTPEASGDWLHASGLPLLLALSGILWIGPYWVWDAPVYFRLCVILVFVTFLLTLGTARRSFSARNVLLALFLIGLFLYFGSHRNGGPFVLSTGWLILLVFVLSGDDVKRVALRYFTIAFAVTLVPAIIVFALSALGFSVPWHAIAATRFDADLLFGNEPGFFRGYPGSVVLNDQVFQLGRSAIFRLSAMYDEPGVVGTFSALLLVANGMRFRGERANVVILIGGILSFSMAFYAMMLVYLLLRRPLLTIVSTASLIGVVLLTPLASNTLVNLLFLSRFAFSGGKLLGDNRVSGLFAAMYEDFWNSDLMTRLFGSAHDVAILVYSGTFSYKLIIYAYGVFGMLALLAFLSAAAMSVSRSKAALMLLVVFLLSIYQRPDVLMLPYLMGLLGGVARLRHDAENLSGNAPIGRVAEVSP